MRKVISIALFLSLATSFGFCPRGIAEETPVDFNTAGKEAAGLLSDYLKIDTTNPPGNEKLGADYLASVLRKNGIEAQIFETAPNRACVYARLKGNGKKKAVILLNHIDVVPAKAEDWKHPPFSGSVHDEELWGRGSLDMKNMGAIELEAMLMIKRSGKLLDRDIIFLGTPDEEVGGVYGAGWFKKHHPELVKDAEFLVNEGYHIDTASDGKVRFWGVDFGEKSALWLKVTAKGEAGHASMPIADSAPNRLVTALSKLVANPPPPIVLPVVKRFFSEVSVCESGERKMAYEDVDKALADPKLRGVLLNDKVMSPMLKNTVSLTVLNAGYKTNVIPGEATAQLDCRLLPGQDYEKFIAQIKEILADKSLDVSVIEWDTAGQSSVDTDLFKAIKAVAAEETPGVPVVPVLTQWFTDSHWFRELGITSYGFEPVELDPEHIASVHGINERVPLKALSDSVRRLYKVLVTVGS